MESQALDDRTWLKNMFGLCKGSHTLICYDSKGGASVAISCKEEEVTSQQNVSCDRDEVGPGGLGRRDRAGRGRERSEIVR